MTAITFANAVHAGQMRSLTKPMQQVGEAGPRKGLGLKRNPIPGSVSRCRGAAGLVSSFRRRCSDDLPLGRSETDITLRPGHGPAAKSTIRVPSASQGGTQAGEEFRSVERLGNVVVSSRVQCGHFVSTCRAARQHDQRFPHPPAQASNDVNAVLIRQRQVHDDGIWSTPRSRPPSPTPRPDGL